MYDIYKFSPKLWLSIVLGPRKFIDILIISDFLILDRFNFCRIYYDGNLIIPRSVNKNMIDEKGNLKDVIIENYYNFINKNIAYEPSNTEEKIIKKIIDNLIIFSDEISLENLEVNYIFESYILNHDIAGNNFTHFDDLNEKILKTKLYFSILFKNYTYEMYTENS